MKNLIFDIEADGLTPSKIWCIVAKDLDSNTIYEYGPDKLEEGIELLRNAETLVGHNIIGYDLPVLRKIYPWFKYDGTAVDTLVLSRSYHPNLMEIDKKRNVSRMPLQLYGRHSLEAYGYRLGEYKGEFGKTSDWSQWAQEMQDYCVQDVNVTTKLCEHFRPYMTRIGQNTASQKY